MGFELDRHVAELLVTGRAAVETRGQQRGLAHGEVTFRNDFRGWCADAAPRLSGAGVAATEVRKEILDPSPRPRQTRWQGLLAPVEPARSSAGKLGVWRSIAAEDRPI
jgi:hypothetical protein